MKVCRAVLVSLVVAPLVLGVSAGGAGAMSQPTRSGALRVRIWITDSYHGNHYTNVWGKIVVTNPAAYRVRANCSVLLAQRASGITSAHLAFSIPAHAVQRSSWYLEPYRSLPDPHVLATCAVLK